MKKENKITVPEIHARLNALAGREIPTKHLSVLLACWRKARGYKNRGRKGWLSTHNAEDFLRYAW